MNLLKLITLCAITTSLLMLSVSPAQAYRKVQPEVELILEGQVESVSGFLYDKTYRFRVEKINGVNSHSNEVIKLIENRGLLASPSLKIGQRYKAFVSQMIFSEDNKPYYLNRAQNL